MNVCVCVCFVCVYVGCCVVVVYLLSFVNFVLVYERVLLRHVTMRRQQRYIKRRGHSHTTINRTAMPIKSIYASATHDTLLCYIRERDKSHLNQFWFYVPSIFHLYTVHSIVV